MKIIERFGLKSSKVRRRRHWLANLFLEFFSKKFRVNDTSLSAHAKIVFTFDDRMLAGHASVSRLLRGILATHERLVALMGEIWRGEVDSRPNFTLFDMCQMWPRSAKRSDYRNSRLQIRSNNVLLWRYFVPQVDIMWTSRRNLARKSILLVPSCVPNLALIGQWSGQRRPKVQYLNKMAAFWRFSAGKINRSLLYPLFPCPLFPIPPNLLSFLFFMPPFSPLFSLLLPFLPFPFIALSLSCSIPSLSSYRFSSHPSIQCLKWKSRGGGTLIYSLGPLSAAAGPYLLNWAPRKWKFTNTFRLSLYFIS